MKFELIRRVHTGASEDLWTLHFKLPEPEIKAPVNNHCIVRPAAFYNEVGLKPLISNFSRWSNDVFTTLQQVEEEEDKIRAWAKAKRAVLIYPNNGDSMRVIGG